MSSLFQLTRALVDIESITGNEERVGDFLFERLQRSRPSHGGSVEKMPVEERRFNVFAVGASRLSPSRHTSIPFRRSSPPAKTVITSGAAAHATRRALSRR